MTVTDQDRRLTKLLEGSLAMARLPHMELQAEVAKINNGTLRHALQVAIDLLDRINVDVRNPALALMIESLRDVLGVTQ